MKKFLSLLISVVMTISGAVYVSASDIAVYGDADNNGKVEIADVSVALNRVLTGISMPVESNPDYMKYMDLNNDGKFDSADVAEILQMVLDSSYVPDSVPTTEATTEITTETTTETTTEVTSVETTTEVTTVEGRSWNMSKSEFTALTNPITSNQVINGLSLYATDAKPMNMFEAEESVNGVTYTNALNLGGGGNLTYRSVAFDVAGENKIDVVIKSSGTTERTLNIVNEDGTVLKTFPATTNATRYSFEVNYTGRIYMYSSASGINIYEIILNGETPETESTTEGTTLSEATTESTTFSGDTSDGVVVNNFSDLKKEIAKKNNKIYVQGTIMCTENVKLSLSNANVEIYGLTNEDGTAATLDFAPFRDSLSKSGSGGTGFTMNGSHYTFRNVIIQNAGDCGIRITGSGAGYSTFENCVFRYNNNSGVSVTNGGSHNTFRFVDSYRNGDLVQKNGADADGFSVKLNAGEENKFYNCRAWENSDDGWDSYDRGTPYIGSVEYIECLAWNNGNPYVFTGEYDYEHGFALDKNLLYVQAVLASNPDFEAQYNAHTVTSWPQVTVRLLGASNTYANIHSKNWAGNPNGFKFGSAETPSSSYRYIKNCIAFDHENTPNQKPAKGFDQNNGYAQYDIENALSFNNGQNYWMDKMSAKSAKGVFYSFNSGQDDAPGDLSLTIPDAAKQAELQQTVYDYRDMIYSYVYNNKIPGEQICNVF